MQTPPAAAQPTAWIILPGHPDAPAHVSVERYSRLARLARTVWYGFLWMISTVATLFVLVCSSMLVSSMRKAIPSEVRISSYILIIATFVTMADMALEALVPDIHKALGAFIALIVVNCIILGRQEAFSSRNTVWRSTLDALGNSAGFTLALLLVVRPENAVIPPALFLAWLSVPLVAAVAVARLHPGCDRVSLQRPVPLQRRRRGHYLCH